MEVPRSQSRLKAIVIRAVDVTHLKNLGEIGELRIERPRTLFGTWVGTACAGAERRRRRGACYAGCNRIRGPPSACCRLVNVADSRQSRTVIAHIPDFQ